MELKQLELQNFRQFTEGTLDFSSGEKGVTVIHGSNGAGKTTLLNAFTWLFYEEVDFDTRPDRLVNEGVISQADVTDTIPVSIRLQFSHEGTEYEAKREAIYEKRSADDLDGEVKDMQLEVKYKQNNRWEERGNPASTLDQIIPERLSSLFFFDGEDIEELAGIDNQGRIQESIQNIMGLTILERATRHLDSAAGRFEDEVEENASDELSQLINRKQSIEEKIEDLRRDTDDTKKAKRKVETEISDIEQKLERLDESAAIQENRDEHERKKSQLEDRVEKINNKIKNEIDERGVVPLAMPLLSDTAEELDQLREDGKIPSELSSSFVESLLEAGQCICGRPLERGTLHYQQVAGMKGDAVAEGVEQNALRVIGHLNQVTEMESTFFDNIDDLISERKDLHDDIEEQTEKIDDLTTELQGMDQTTQSGESISELESKREDKMKEREHLISELGKIDERIEQKQDEIEDLEKKIDEQEDERDEAVLAKRRQRAAELVCEELDEAFEQLKDRIRKLSNQKISQTFDEIATKDLSAEINEDFKLKIRQRVNDDWIEVDKSTGERQIASLAFIGSLVDIARERYQSDSDSEYFSGGIYPLVMDSPFGALDDDHRREVSRVIPQLANQVVVFATDSQWEGPVKQEMTPVVGQEYWLNFNKGEGSGEFPKTRIQAESIAVKGD
jgi:DNA sulfur modification protein DndD